MSGHAPRSVRYRTSDGVSQPLVMSLALSKTSQPSMQTECDR